MAEFPSVRSSYSVVKVPQFQTLIVKYGNWVEQRRALQTNPNYKFTLQFELLDPSDADLILAFFVARKGAYEAFYLTNPEEAYRSSIWVAATTYSEGTIIRPITANGRSYKCTTAGISGNSEPTWPTTNNESVTDGTSPNEVIWEENSYLVRFEEDMMNFDYFSYSLYNLGSISFIEVPE